MRQGVVDVITRDDSVVQRMLAAGMISADQAREHPQKNQLIAALGIEGEIDAHTVVRPVELRNGDAFLLCTDGWWDAFDAATLATTFAQAANPTDWLDAMRQRIEARSLPRQDNFSAIAIWIGDRDDAESQSPEDTLPRVRLT
jgi:serine/threonine protein phosphatase PrpC